MKVHLIFLIISFVPLIQNSIAQGYGYQRQYGSQYGDQYDDQYGGQYGGQNEGRMDRPIHSGRNIAGRSRALNLGNAAENAVGFISKKSKQVVKLIRCTLQCFIKYFVSNYCNRMFPCLYDCSIGQSYIAPEIEKQLKSAKNIYPRGFELNDVFKVFRCLYNCAMERPIKDWETFAAALYCVADTCICFNIFGSGMN